MMAAFVDHHIEKGFLLDEERLRKLADIIGKRLSKVSPPTTHTFRVFKADSYSYETTRIEDVVAEDNADWRRITRLDVEAAQDKQFEFRLSFGDDDTSLRIVGDDRDQVFVLFSDLREYLVNEVNVGIVMSRDGGRMASMVIALGAVVLLFALVGWMASGVAMSDERVAAALATTDLAEKLNVLIESQKRYRDLTDSVFPWLLLVPLAMLMSMLDWVGYTLRLFFPGNMFLFGDQRRKYERRQKLKSNLFWGVCVAAVIGLLVSLLAWKLTT